MEEQTLNELMDLIRSQLRQPESDALDATTALVRGGLALDSIRLLELADAVERRFSLVLDADDLAAMTTVGAFAARVAAKRA